MFTGWKKSIYIFKGVFICSDCRVDLELRNFRVSLVLFIGFLFPSTASRNNVATKSFQLKFHATGKPQVCHNQISMKAKDLQVFHWPLETFTHNHKLKCRSCKQNKSRLFQTISHVRPKAKRKSFSSSN